MDKDIYVIVAEKPGYFYDPPEGQDASVVLETCVRESSLKEAEERLENLPKRFGQCRIAKLSFVEESEQCAHKYGVLQSEDDKGYVVCSACGKAARILGDE